MEITPTQAVRSLTRDLQAFKKKVDSEPERVSPEDLEEIQIKVADVSKLLRAKKLAVEHHEIKGVAEAALQLASDPAFTEPLIELQINLLVKGLNELQFAVDQILPHEWREVKRKDPSSEA